VLHDTEDTARTGADATVHTIPLAAIAEAHLNKAAQLFGNHAPGKPPHPKAKMATAPRTRNKT
jgi:hypothetical protein